MKWVSVPGVAPRVPEVVPEGVPEVVPEVPEVPEASRRFPSIAAPSARALTAADFTPAAVLISLALALKKRRLV